MSDNYSLDNNSEDKKPSSKPGFTQNDFEILNQERAYAGFSSFDRLTISHKRYLGGSQTISRELLVRHDAVAILLFDPVLDVVVLVEQFRVGAVNDKNGPWMLELVAGLIDSDELPEQIAKRECMEEAGCMPTSLTLISAFYLSPGVSSEKMHLYMACIDASNLGGVHGLASEGEDIRVHVVPALKALEWLGEGQINNAITIVGLQWLLVNRHNILQGSTN